MICRDTHRDKEYFNALIKKEKKIFRESEKRIIDGKVPETRLQDVYYLNTRDHIDLLIAYYSLGLSSKELSEKLILVIDLMVQYWNSDRTKVDVRVKGKTKKLDQYMLEPYEYFLKVLSLAYLLEITDDHFKKLVAIVDRDNVSDKLYETIIQARIPDRTQEKDENYSEKHSVILKTYKRLREACNESDKTKAASLIKIFLEKDFYHKHMVLYNSHKKKLNLYRGYWSFEAAAVAKIYSLDDSDFKDHPYYPSDLVS